jgi:hypothetical protein
MGSTEVDADRALQLLIAFLAPAAHSSHAANPLPKVRLRLKM